METKLKLNVSLTDFYTPRGIVFIPTFNCTCMCRHCNNNFNKRDLSLYMDYNRAISILYEAKKAGLNSIQMTGGEITMYPEFMINIVPHARKLAMRINKPPTNCYIAQDVEKTEKFFYDLKNADYRSGFRISIDPYHNNVIKISKIADFIVSYKKFFKLSTLTIGSCYYDRHKIFELYEELMRCLTEKGIKEIYIDKEKRSFVVEGDKIKYGIWKPTRPSWQELNDVEVELKKIEKTFACLGPKGVGYLWIEPDMKVRICSCNGNNFNDYLVIGDLNKETLQEIITKASENKIFKVLANEGAAGLRKVLNFRDNILDENKKYTFMCELCNEMLGNGRYLEILKNNLEISDA
jgi:pyruvate-formate lyase-activating enzyme